MITIASHVSTWLDTHPFVADHLHQGLINQAALARTIKTDIEAETKEKVSVEAVAMAIGRKEYYKNEEDVDLASFIGDITLQSGLSIVNFRADEFQSATKAAVASLQSKREFHVLTQGIWQAGLIAPSKTIDSLPLETKHITRRKDSLVGITIKLDEDHEPIIGVCAYIISLLSHAGTNLEEIISTEHEMTVIVPEQYARQATDTLMNAKQNQKELL